MGALLQSVPLQDLQKQQSSSLEDASKESGSSFTCNKFGSFESADNEPLLLLPSFEPAGPVFLYQLVALLSVALLVGVTSRFGGWLYVLLLCCRFGYACCMSKRVGFCLMVVQIGLGSSRLVWVGLGLGLGSSRLVSLIHVVFNGKLLVNACNDPQKYISWDGLLYSQAVNGSFSDSPVPGLS